MVWAVRGRALGQRGEKRRAREKGKSGLRGEGGPANGLWVGFGFLLSYFYFFSFSISNQTNLGEIKFKFEFTTSTQTTKAMHQHVCNNTIKPKEIFNYLDKF